MKIAIIGGTGVYDPRILTGVRELQATTPYGAINVTVGTWQGQEIVFMARHGKGHTVPPHMINYRANMWGLAQLGVERVLTTTAVGSLNPDMKPGDFVLIDQFLDFTKVRQSTYFDGKDGKVVHLDYTEPYCPEVRAAIREAASQNGISINCGGCYVCTEGPRFESKAEILAYRRLGGDLVGMTNVPEVILARELGMCYATISMVTNYAAGISPTPLTHQEVLDVMAANGDQLKSLLMSTLPLIPAQRSCHCDHEQKPAVERG
jgi:5'-methylthioadenosine phosphorylase